MRMHGLQQRVPIEARERLGPELLPKPAIACAQLLFGKQLTISHKLVAESDDLPCQDFMQRHVWLSAPWSRLRRTSATSASRAHLERTAIDCAMASSCGCREAGRRGFSASHWPAT